MKPFNEVNARPYKKWYPKPRKAKKPTEMEILFASIQRDEAIRKRRGIAKSRENICRVVPPSLTNYAALMCDTRLPKFNPHVPDAIAFAWKILRQLKQRSNGALL